MSKLGTKNGEYLVMCPEMGRRILKNGSLKCNDEERLIKAYTKDPKKYHNIFMLVII